MINQLCKKQNNQNIQYWVNATWRAMCKSGKYCVFLLNNVLSAPIIQEHLDSNFVHSHLD